MQLDGDRELELPEEGVIVIKVQVPLHSDVEPDVGPVPAQMMWPGPGADAATPPAQSELRSFGASGVHSAAVTGSHTNSLV